MPKGIELLQGMILKLSKMGESRTLTKDLRNLTAAAAKAGDKLPNFLDGISEAIEFHSHETRSWKEGHEIAAGEGGKVDACDFIVWLTIAQEAGLSVIPAKEILELSEDEMSIAGGQIKPGEQITGGRAATKIRSILKAAYPEIADKAQDQLDDQEKIDAVIEKLYKAMDDVPEGWMVRSGRCGPASLKSLAGVGLAGDRSPEVRFDPDLEIGPGWIRDGNRRRVDTGDMRIIKGAAEGPDKPTRFYARPWVPASRWMITEDIHRVNSPFAGKGCWPAEWRVFVHDGVVQGVSAYYCWAGEPTPEAARQALDAVALTEKVISKAYERGIVPVFMPIEFLRRRPDYEERYPDFKKGTLDFTLDFLETKDGLMVLEGGPGWHPAGGAHPCGFAGISPQGVALRSMPGINLGEPKTWRETDRAGSIFTWEEAKQLARQGTKPPMSPSI